MKTNKVVQLSWELLEHKLIYHHGIPARYLHVEDISNELYEEKEKEYVKLKQKENPNFKYEIVGFPSHTPSGKLVVQYAKDEYEKIHGKAPNWNI